MSTLASDDFNRADGPLGANWRILVAGPTIASNRFQPDAGTVYQFSIYDAITPPPDQWVQATYSTTIGYGVLFLRLSGTSNADANGYIFVTNSGDAGSAGIYKIVNGVQTLLQSASAVPSGGWSLYFEIQGTTLVAKQSATLGGGATGTVVATVTDATFSSGKTGLAPIASFPMDDFVTGDFGAGAAKRFLLVRR